jgi:hypothetical protein
MMMMHVHDYVNGDDVHDDDDVHGDDDDDDDVVVVVVVVSGICKGFTC